MAAYIIFDVEVTDPTAAGVLGHRLSGRFCATESTANNQVMMFFDLIPHGGHHDRS